MKKASLSNGAGPGSSISLAPETVRIRDALIKKFSGAPLEDLTNFVTMALSKETDEFRRLGILAARIYLLRHRVANLQEFNRTPSLTSMQILDTTTLSHNLTTAAEPAIIEDVDTLAETGQWSRLQMTEPGEVNGVRFLAGTIIDAQTQDADKLINSGKAVRIEEDDMTKEQHHDDFNDSDADANATDKAAEAVDDDTPASQNPDDDTDVEVPQVVSEDDAQIEADGSNEASEADIMTKDDQPQKAEADEKTKV